MCILEIIPAREKNFLKSIIELKEQNTEELMETKYFYFYLHPC